MALLMAWQAAEGMRVPRTIDTGIDLITAVNVDDFLAAYRLREGSDHQADQRRPGPYSA